MNHIRGAIIIDSFELHARRLYVGRPNYQTSAIRSNTERHTVIRFDVLATMAISLDIK